MNKYKIIIKVTEVGGVYDAENMQQAKKFANELCNETYIRLKEKACVEIESVKEVKGRNQK